MTEDFDEQFHLRMRTASQEVKNWYRMQRKLLIRGLTPLPLNRAVLAHQLEPGLIALFGDVGEEQ